MMGDKTDGQSRKVTQHKPANGLPRNLAQHDLPPYSAGDAEHHGGEFPLFPDGSGCGMVRKPAVMMAEPFKAVWGSLDPRRVPRLRRTVRSKDKRYPTNLA